MQLETINRELRRDVVEPAPGARMMPQEEAAPVALNFNIKRNLRIYRKPAMIAGVLVAIALLGLGLSMKTKYRAEAVLYVEPIKPGATTNDTATATMVDSTKYMALLDQLTQTIKRQDLLEAAVRSLPAGVWRGPHETVEAAAGRLNANLRADRQATSFQLAVDLSGASPTDTPTALNAVIAQFLVEQKRLEDQNWDIRIKLLGDERTRIQNELDAARKDLAETTMALGIRGFTMEEKNLQSEALVSLRTELAGVDRDRSTVASQLQTGAVDAGLTGDSANSQFRNQIEMRQAALRQQMSGMTTLNPLYRQDADELAALEHQLAADNAHAQDRQEKILRAKMQQSESLGNELRRRMSQQTAAMAAATPLLQRATELNGRVTDLEEGARAIESAFRTARLERQSPSTVRIVEQAPPIAPMAASKRKLMYLAALPIGALAAVITAVLMGFVQPRIYVPSDVKHAVGLNTLSAIPAIADVSASVRDEYYLRIASSVEQAYTKRNAQAFLFTSVGGSDSRKVLQRVRDQLQNLGYTPRCVKAETLLCNKREFEKKFRGGSYRQESQQRTDDTLSSARLRQLRAGHDMILIESHGLLSSAETEYAARSADAVILVCQSGVTDKAELEAAVELLEHLNARAIGVIVDGVQLKDADTMTRRRVRATEQLGAMNVLQYSGSQKAIAAEKESQEA